MGRRKHCGQEKKSGIDDCVSDTNGHCDMIWANTLDLNHDLMEDRAIPSNLSVPKVLEPDWAATSACAKKGPKPREHVQLFRMKRVCTKGFY